MWPRVGDWVEVRTKQEILATLDSNGRLDGLPFMPQMFKYCGHSFQIFKIGHKTCDTVNRTGGRRLVHGIHLDLRCDGKAYGGCQAACLIFWKEAWLKPAAKVRSGQSVQMRDVYAANPESLCLEHDLVTTCVTKDGDESYQCQAVRLPYFTKPLPWWRPDQYFRDYVSGNTTLRGIRDVLVYSAYCKLTRAHHPTLGRPWRWLYDRIQSLRGGIPYPRHKGRLTSGQPSPVANLNVQPGELVRVKTYNEILATITYQNTNRGLYFDAELVPYCGGTYRVRARVEKFIDEKTGKMVFLKTPAIMLEDVYCRSCYSNRRMFCPRSIFSWWREAWLERIESPSHREHGPSTESFATNADRTASPVSADSAAGGK